MRDSHLMTELFGAQRRFHDRRVLAEANAFHRRILAAVRQGDSETARAVAAEHVRVSLAYNLESFDRRRDGDGLSTLNLPDDVREELSRVEPRPRRPSRKPRR